MSSTSASAKPSILAPVAVMFVVGFIAGYLTASFLPALNSPQSTPHQSSDGRITTGTHPRDERVPAEGETQDPQSQETPPVDGEKPATPEHPEEPSKAPTH